MTKTTTIISTNSDPSSNALLYPLCTFLLSLYTLEDSTSLFINSTARIAHRLRISETLISLFTAGAEWEELFVVVAALIQNRPRLALGNVLGSGIGNILGAFSLGILVQSGVVKFDASAKRYAIVLFAVTTAVVLVWALGQVSTKPVGAVLVVAFGVYAAVVGWSIYRGVLAAPEDSDSDSDSDSESSTIEQEPDESGLDLATIGDWTDEGVEADESVALLGRRGRKSRRILWDLAKLIVGFIALSMSGYILSHSSQLLAARFEISESVFGATLLSLATTLPEKFVAVVSGARGHPGILVANTVGSNIFLLTLCLGITILGSPNLTIGSSYTHEMIWLWASSAVLVLVIMIGSHRLIGVAMLIAYMTFLVLEFVLYKS